MESMPKCVTKVRSQKKWNT